MYALLHKYFGVYRCQSRCVVVQWYHEMIRHVTFGYLICWWALVGLGLGFRGCLWSWPLRLILWPWPQWLNLWPQPTRSTSSPWSALPLEVNLLALASEVKSLALTMASEVNPRPWPGLSGKVCGLDLGVRGCLSSWSLRLSLWPRPRMLSPWPCP